MHVTVQRDVRLSFLDELPDRDAANMNVERHVIDHATVEAGSVEKRVVGWRVKEEDGVAQVVLARKLPKVLQDGITSSSTVR